MITLKNCRLIPELTEDYDDVMADILLDGKVIREINAPGTGTKGETVMDLEGKRSCRASLTCTCTSILTP